MVYYDVGAVPWTRNSTETKRRRQTPFRCIPNQLRVSSKALTTSSSSPLPFLPTPAIPPSTCRALGSIIPEITRILHNPTPHGDENARHRLPPKPHDPQAPHRLLLSPIPTSPPPQRQLPYPSPRKHRVKPHCPGLRRHHHPRLAAQVPTYPHPRGVPVLGEPQDGRSWP